MVSNGWQLYGTGILISGTFLDRLPPGRFLTRPVDRVVAYGKVICFSFSLRRVMGYTKMFEHSEHIALYIFPKYLTGLICLPAQCY